MIEAFIGGAATVLAAVAAASRRPPGGTNVASVAERSKLLAAVPIAGVGRDLIAVEIERDIVDGVRARRPAARRYRRATVINNWLAAIALASFGITMILSPPAFASVEVTARTWWVLGVSVPWSTFYVIWFHRVYSAWAKDDVDTTLAARSRVLDKLLGTVDFKSMDGRLADEKPAGAEADGDEGR